MASFFSEADTVELVANTHELQLVSIFQPYIIANLDYVDFLRETPGLRLGAACSTGHWSRRGRWKRC